MKNIFQLNNKNFNIKVLTCFVLLIPILLISGPFLPDLFVTISIIFFVIVDKEKYLIKSIKNFTIIKFLFFVWIFLITTSLFSNDIFYSLKSSFFWFRHVIFAIVICFLLINEKKFLNYFYYSIIFVIFFASLDGIYQFLFNKDVFGYVRNGARLTGPFGDEQILGSFIVRLLPLGIALSFYFNKKTPMYLMILTASITILLSTERTAIAYLFIIIFLLTLFSYKEKIYRYFLFFISILFFIIITQFPSVTGNVLYKTQSQLGIKLIENITVSKFFSSPHFSQNKKDSIYLFSEAHESHIFTALNIFKNNKVIGAGPKMFRKDCGLKENYIDKFSCTTHPHNTIAQLLAETGLIGIAIYIILIFVFVRELIINFYKYCKDQKIKKYYIFCLIGFVPIFSFFLPSGNIFNNFLSILTFLPLGFIIYFRYYE